MALPSTYQEVEYIESSGTQYMKIGTQFKTSYKTVIDFQMTVTGGDYVPIGVRADDGRYKRYGIDAWELYFKVIAGGGDWNNTIAEDTNRHTITLDKSTAIVDGTSYSVQYADYTFNDGIGVFYYHKIGETPYVEAISSNKLYKLDIYDENGTHIYDLVPVVRKSDNKPGLYDLLNNVFYTNQGTGEFEYPAQSGKIKKITLGTNLIRPVEPVEITETYTLSTTSYNDNLFKKVAKSGYKIKEINIKGQCENYHPGVEWYSATYAGLAIGETYPRFVFDVSHGTYHDKKGKIQYVLDGQRQELYATSDSPISANSWNTCECTFTREGFNFSINGHQYSGSYSSGMIDKITQIMDNSNATIYLNTIRGYVRDYTYTITYISS